MTVIIVLIALGLIALVGAIWNKLPIWVAVLFLYLIELLRALPSGNLR